MFPSVISIFNMKREVNLTPGIEEDHGEVVSLVK